MTVQQELRKCLLEYPGIFPNKWSVYHHWFCVNGSGYHWVNGELTDGGTELSLEEAVIAQIEGGLESTINIRQLEFKFDRVKQKISQLFKLEERMIDFTLSDRDKKYPIYPMYTHGSNILNIPDNIKPDWKEAVIEFATWMLNSGIKIEDDHKRYLVDYLSKNSEV